MVKIKNIAAHEKRPKEDDKRKEDQNPSRALSVKRVPAYIRVVVPGLAHKFREQAWFFLRVLLARRCFRFFRLAISFGSFWRRLDMFHSGKRLRRLRAVLVDVGRCMWRLKPVFYYTDRVILNNLEDDSRNALDIAGRAAFLFSPIVNITSCCRRWMS
jgi:hypothetical protein